MRKIIFVIMLTCMSTVLFGQQLKLQPAVFDFGTIKEVDGEVTAMFTITNISNTPYIMIYSYSGCGCVAAEISKEPLMMGKSRAITVTFNPERRPGVINKEVVLVSDNAKRRDTLRLVGEVIPRPKSLEEMYPVVATDGVKLSDDKLPFGIISQGSKHTAFINIFNSSSRRVTIDGVIGSSIGELRISSRQLEANREGQVEFSFNLEDRDIFGVVSDTIRLIINGREWDKPIIANGLSIYDVFNVDDKERENAPIAIVSPRNYDLYGEDRKKVIPITNTGVSELKILAVVTEYGEIDYKLKNKTIKRGDKAELIVELLSSEASVSILTNDPLSPIITIKLKHNNNE